MEKALKILLTEKELRHTLQGLRGLEQNMEYCIEFGCEENKGILKTELEEVRGIIKKLEGF